jgi:hypothetical protein
MPLDNELLGPAATPAMVQQRVTDMASRVHRLFAEVTGRFNENTEKMEAAYDATRTKGGWLEGGRAGVAGEQAWWTGGGTPTSATLRLHGSEFCSS